MKQWIFRLDVFAVIATTGAASVGTWLLFGPEALGAVAAVAAFLVLKGRLVARFLLNTASELGYHRPVKPADRDRRREQREARRRAQAGARSRYGYEPNRRTAPQGAHGHDQGAESRQ